MEAGLSAAEVNVALVGVLPTLDTAYLTSTFRADAGVVISSSHNPYFDNGIKLFSYHGIKLTDAQGRYIKFCNGTFPADLSLTGLRIVEDYAHGEAYQVAPAVYQELGVESLNRVLVEGVALN